MAENNPPVPFREDTRHDHSRGHHVLMVGGPGVRSVPEIARRRAVALLSALLAKKLQSRRSKFRKPSRIGIGAP
jgi:hypothetical protein